MKGCPVTSSNKEWLTIADLAIMHIPGLNVSSVTLHRRANKEKWKKRKKEGVQGVAYEYHVSSLPPEAQIALGYPAGETVEPTPHNIAPTITNSAQANQLLDDFNALSQEAQRAFLLKASQQVASVHDSGAQALLTIWDGLEPMEKELLSKLLVRKGSELLAQLLNEDNLCLMQLSGEKREAALILAQLVPERVREILSELRASRDMAGSGHQQNVDDQHKGVA